MKTWFSLGVAVVTLLATASSGTADETSHRKAAEELLKVMKVDQQLEASIDQSLDVQIKANPALEPFKAVMKKFLSKHMGWESLKDEIISIYADAFEEDELKKIREFYETPTGKKMIEKTPTLLAKGMQLGLKRVQEHQDELRQMIQNEASKQK